MATIVWTISARKDVDSLWGMVDGKTVFELERHTHRRWRLYSLINGRQYIKGSRTRRGGLSELMNYAKEWQPAEPEPTDDEVRGWIRDAIKERSPSHADTTRRQ